MNNRTPSRVERISADIAVIDLGVDGHERAWPLFVRQAARVGVVRLRGVLRGDSRRVPLAAVLMQDQRDDTTVRIRLEAHLSGGNCVEELSIAFRKDLEFPLSSRLVEQMIALSGDREHLLFG